MAKTDELTVFMSNRETTCADCGAGLMQDELITLKPPGNTPFCLSCSDLDHLVYLASGNSALTTRARKYSPLSPVVVKFSKVRKRNERQGVLVSAQGLARAEEECLSDEDLRAVRRERDRARRDRRDAQYVQDFAVAIRRLYPGCPEEIATLIAEHACEKYSGRVGRSASAKALDDQYVTLAVRAHVRHAETRYDELLSQCYARDHARELIQEELEGCLSKWRQAATCLEQC